MTGTISRFESALLELIRDVSTNLPPDVEKALTDAGEHALGTELEILSTILENTALAREQSKPLCQDTGTPILYISHPCSVTQKSLKESVKKTIALATLEVPLRPNSVDPLSGENTGDNLGAGLPVIMFSEWERQEIQVDLMMKGGGSENATILYKLPNARLNAGRDVEGVKKCVLDAVYATQGRACSPTVVGVGIGGLSGTSISLSQKQFFRRLDDENPDPCLKEIEQELYQKLNGLGIGAMGLGGNTTVLAVKAGKLSRHPASFFVAVSFNCWALRRKSMSVKI